MGWCGYYWVYGASSVAIHPGGGKQFLLVSVICRVVGDAASFLIPFFQSHYGHESLLSESKGACGANRPG